jgi:hypothetical protein
MPTELVEKTKLPGEVTEMIENVANGQIKKLLTEWAREYQNQFNESFNEKKRDAAFNQIRKFENDRQIFDLMISIQKVLIKKSA